MRQVCETLLEMLKEAAKIGKGCATLNAFRGVTHEIARAIVKTGVDFVSSGALTHSVKVVDLTMEFAQNQDRYIHTSSLRSFMSSSSNV